MTLPAAALAGTRAKSLWRLFWIDGVLISLLLLGLICSRRDQWEWPALALQLLAYLLYTGWVLRQIWRRAGEARTDDAQSAEWAQVARGLCIAWAINALLLSMFLLLGRIADPVTAQATYQATPAPAAHADGKNSTAPVSSE